MDSQNWRVKHDPREEPKSEGSERSKSRKSWKPMPGYSGPQQSWTSLPEYPNTQPLYRGGRNPTRPAWMDPIRRPTSDVAITVDAKAHQAIDQGRRLYVGNLQYRAKLHDLQSLFADVQDSIEDISMSIDPMTGRNPSYCFIDFVSRDAAQRVIREYNGQMFMDRRLKVRPGVKSGTSTQSRRFHLQAEPRKDDSNSSLLQMEMRASPMAFNRWRRLNDQFDPSDYNNAVIQEQRRLYVGGLPRFPNQVEANIQIRDLFAGFNVEVVSKMVSPHTSVQAEPGNHYYCFVDLATSEEATEAVKALNGVERWNWTVVVSTSTKKSGKLTERQRIYVSGLPYFSNARALQNEMKTLFEPFGEVKVVSKLFDERDVPNKSDGVTRNCYYCFVELADSKQADAAIEKWGPIIRVKGSNRKMGYDD